MEEIMRKFYLALTALLIPLLPLAASAHDHDDWHRDDWHGRGEWHEGWHGDHDWHHHWHGGYYAGGVYYPAGYYAPYYAPAPVVVAPQPVYYAPPVLSFGLSLGH